LFEKEKNMEIWRQLLNFPDYVGSTEGRVKNVRTQRVLKTYTDPRGYTKVTLRNDCMSYTVKVARVIAETFLGDHSDMVVRHKDNVRSNCRVDNLEWVTRKELIPDAFDGGTKQPTRKVAVRVIETGEVFDTIRACAKHNDCSQSDICKCLNGTRHSVKGLHFEHA
jgi:hypothetical protein